MGYRIMLLSITYLSLSLSALLTGVAMAATDPADTEALRAFRRTIGDPNDHLHNWVGDDPCGDSWTGVFCNDSPGDIRSVVELRLLNQNLTGELAPELGNLKNLHILDVMWNQITGGIPKELGNLKQLQLLLLNGNNLMGMIPDELGYLPMLDRLQIDLNQIVGPIPSTFKNLIRLKHLHMNNNSLNGSLPSGLGSLPLLLHLLVENNNLNGEIPADLANASTLRIIQLDNNPFTGATIPSEFGNLPELNKLSLRNCNLVGEIPDLSRLTKLQYLDLSNNNLKGGLPLNLPNTITTIDLSFNHLHSFVPESYGNLPNLQTLVLRNNNLFGHIPESLGTGLSFTSWNGPLIIDFQNNSLALISNNLTEATGKTVNIWLHGNPRVCNSTDILISMLCKEHTQTFIPEEKVKDNTYGPGCDPLTCSPGEEPIPIAFYTYNLCRCALPIVIGYRIKSPGFSFLTGYVKGYQSFIASGINVSDDQVYLDSFLKQPGPRFATVLKVFPPIQGERKFNMSEVMRIYDLFSGWRLPANDTMGPQELLFFQYAGLNVTLELFGSKRGTLNWGVIAAIMVACITLATALVAAALFRRIMRTRRKSYSHALTFSSKGGYSQRLVKVTGVRRFSFREMEKATHSFDSAMQVGQGGYGQVFRGVLEDGHIVAIKRAKEGSFQGVEEFYTEIELLSRLHHCNLVSLVGYCDDEGEQMLVYEFMANGTLRDHLDSSLGRNQTGLHFAQRLRIALGAARGILYLHTEANPPIFHRDIKAANILLDDKNNARVADFGLSKLAPIPEIEGSNPGYVSTVVKGTPGYLDPEYFLTHKLTDKSDVYSFGVVLLELITGMHPISMGKNIVREVRSAFENGMVLEVIDPNLATSEALHAWITLALSCCNECRESRPSMAEVVRDLEALWLSLMPLSTDSIPLSQTSSSHHNIESVQENLIKADQDPARVETSSFFSCEREPFTDVASHRLVDVAPR